MDKRTTVSLFGPGALGGAIIDLIPRLKEYRLHSVWGRSAEECLIYSETAEPIPADKPFPESSSDLGSLILIAVPDGEIAPLARKLASQNVQWNNRSVVHLSGSQPADSLSELKDCGARTATLHPLQTFTRGDDYRRFEGIWFTLQGDESLFPELEHMIKQAGAQSVQMTAKQKSGMHLAAVFASNYLVALMRVVEQITQENNIENGLNLLQPIIQQTIQNIFEKGPQHSLSGPVARGDLSTLSAHLQALNSNPELETLYRQLGKKACHLAIKSGQLNEESAEKVMNLFNATGDE